MRRIWVLFFLFWNNSFTQELLYKSPIRHKLSQHIVAQNIFLENDYSLTDKDISATVRVQHHERTVYYLSLQFSDQDPVNFIIDDKEFSVNGELFFIDLHTNGWVGPYYKYMLGRNSAFISGRLHTDQILIEYSVADNNYSGFPVKKIIKPIRKSVHQDSIPRTLRRKRTSRERDKILLTGYWPPSNEGIRPFSTNEIILNPNGWIGNNWEDRGYDIVSYFPTFYPADCTDCGQGDGDLEVDYQDTSEDWFNIIDSINPVAIITFSRGFIDYSWELEWKYYNLANWNYDFTPPYLPTPNPPDSHMPVNGRRYTSLPLDPIIYAIDSANLGLNPYVDYTTGAGAYLSEFMGYHGAWTKARMDSANVPCYLAGHIHVGGLIDWETAHEAVKISLREVIKVVDYYKQLPGDINGDSVISITDLIIIVFHILGTNEMSAEQIQTADLNFDLVITIEDVLKLADIVMGN